MFELPKLDYPYNALEPVIDSRTMEIHHTKHHQAYVDNLNKALPDGGDLEEVLRNLDKVPEEMRTKVRNNGGGHYNHSLFWKWMTPGGKKGDGRM
jgi:Fe-Mn family superoxide dismutase